MGEIAKATFTHGPGSTIIQLVLMSAVGWFGGTIASALGKGQLANIINLVTVFGAIGLVGASIIGALKVFFSVATGNF